MRKIELKEGNKICEACDGKGEVCYSCCTGQIITGDILMCPRCHEHLGDETCEDCNGEGQVPEDQVDFPDKVDVGMRAEMYNDYKFDR